MSDPQQPQNPPYAPPHYGQPGHPAPDPAAPVYPAYASQPGPQGYALNGQPFPGTAPSRPTGRGNPPGRLGFVFGVIGLGLSLVFAVVQRALIFSQGYAAIDALTWVQVLLNATLAILALVFGLIGLRRPGSPHGMAGIAVGLGIAALAGMLINLILNLLTPLFYGF